MNCMKTDSDCLLSYNFLFYNDINSVKSYDYFRKITINIEKNLYLGEQLFMFDTKTHRRSYA